MTSVCNALMQRCAAGNTWPPSLAEFVALVAESGAGVLGLTVGDVLQEYHDWRNDSYKYNCSENYPWRQPVLYQICTALKREAIERQLTPGEFESLAGRLLARWEKHVTDGKQIPPIRAQIAPPRHQTGPSPAQLLYEEYKRRKAAQGGHDN